MSDWSELPYELIQLIANNLDELEDVMSFSAVCHSWRLVYKNKDWMQSRRIPWLMLGEFSEHDVTRRKFFSASRCKWYSIPLPEPHAYLCRGTSHGWIVMLDRGYGVHLLNPITQHFINLPPLSVLQSGSSAAKNWFTAVNKMFVVKQRDKLVINVTHFEHERLSYFKTGDRNWTTVQFSKQVLMDVICFKDQIIVVTLAGKLMLLEMDGGESPKELSVASPLPEFGHRLENIYLVESAGNLLLVVGYELTPWRQHSLRFKVYKLDDSQSKWNPVYDLGDTFLLVDDWRCTSGSAYGCFKSNCIYYANDNLDSYSGDRQHEGQQKVTVYNVKHERREVYSITDNYPYCYTCPMWFIPSLW